MPGEMSWQKYAAIRMRVKGWGLEEGAVIGREPRRRQETEIRQQMSKGSREGAEGTGSQDSRCLQHVIKGLPCGAGRARSRSKGREELCLQGYVTAASAHCVPACKSAPLMRFKSGSPPTTGARRLGEASVTGLN